MPTLEELADLLQEGIERARQPLSLDLQAIVDPEVSALFCADCGGFLTRSGCPDHARQQELF